MTIELLISLVALVFAIYAAWGLYVINEAVMILIDDYRERVLKENPRTYNPDVM